MRIKTSLQEVVDEEKCQGKEAVDHQHPRGPTQLVLTERQVLALGQPPNCFQHSFRRYTGRLELHRLSDEAQGKQSVEEGKGEAKTKNGGTKKTGNQQEAE